MSSLKKNSSKSVISTKAGANGAVTAQSDVISSPKDVLRDVFRHAALCVEQEMEALDSLNKRKALSEVADLFDISSHELFYYMEYGEEEAERIFNLNLQTHSLTGASEFDDSGEKKPCCSGCDSK